MDRARGLVAAPGPDRSGPLSRLSLPGNLSRPLPGQPWSVLLPLVAVQWAAVAAFALSVQRNGWLFYQGGDQTWYYTGAWLLSQGELPPTLVGYGWSVVLAPIALVAGPDLTAALPAIVLLQAGLLLPVALLCVYGIAASFGGRLLGYWAAALWVAAPFAAIPLFDPRYHDRYVEQFLPQAFGLTALADFPSMVLLLGSAFFLVRALRTGDWADGALSGLAAGFAIAVKPSNGLYVAAPLVALALARRARPALSFSLALVPAFATLALWKYLGLGHIPAFTAPEVRLAAAGAGLAVSIPGPLERYVDLDWEHLHRNYLDLREFFWSVRIPQWLPLAGAIAVARRSLPAAVLLGVWFGLFLVAKGTFVHASVATGSFWRFLMPAWPAYLLLAAAIPLLLPVWGLELASRFSAAARALPHRRALVTGAVAVLALAPLPLVALSAQPAEARAISVAGEATLVPVDERFGLEAEATAERHRLTWRAPGVAGERVFYRVYRAPQGAELVCPDPARPGACELPADVEIVATTRETHWQGRAPEGSWTYRVGLGANWRDDPELGDTLLLSPPASP